MTPSRVGHTNHSKRFPCCRQPECDPRKETRSGVTQPQQESSSLRRNEASYVLGRVIKVHSCDRDVQNGGRRKSSPVEARRQNL